MSILVVSKLMGHSQINTSMIYAKVGEAIKRRSIEKLDDLSQDGPKMGPHNLPVKELEGE